MRKSKDHLAAFHAEIQMAKLDNCRYLVNDDEQGEEKGEKL